MIESLTPEIIVVSVLLVVVSAPLLTLVVSLLLLWRYRLVVQQMMAGAGADDVAALPSASSSPASARGPGRGAPVASGDTFRRLQAKARHCAIRYLLAGLAFAVVFASAAGFVYDFGLGLPGFVTGVCIYLWPSIIAVLLILDGSPGFRAIFVAAYFGILVLLGWWASTVFNVPGYEFGGLTLPARSSVTPLTLGRLWLGVNAAPTLLVLAFLNRHVRAVAPLVLALIVVAASGTWAAFLALFSPAGIDAAVRVMEVLGVNAIVVVIGAVLLSLVLFGALGWYSARWVTSAYALKATSDQSLALDALWLVFTGAYAMWLALGGIAWIAAAPLAFLAFKLTLFATGRQPGKGVEPPRGLTFLRVFALGRRTEALFDQVGRLWRYGGSVQIITGPDLARSTVQPHQFLDFLSGRLRNHFVRDTATLERSLGVQDRAMDPDGRYRINNFFCHHDTWQLVLPRITQQGDAVLMDLRLFTPDRAGCLYEIRYLVTQVPLASCVFIVDQSTDVPFLRGVLEETLGGLPPGSPNAGKGVHDVCVHGLDRGSAGLSELIRRLCAVA